MNAGGPSRALRVCAAADLVEGGAGVRLDARSGDGPATVFFVRYEGGVHGYVNRCAHVPMELDWNPGQFFDSSGLYLMCSTHGAIYEPDTGRCVGGPCRGARLRPLAVEERADGADAAGAAVFWLPDGDVQPVLP
jgi:nitrite reductase/ring-hydroxylating ferredoxin subunit